MSGITHEQLTTILEEKLAPFKKIFDDLNKSAEEAKELLNFTSKKIWCFTWKTYSLREWEQDNEESPG